MPAKHHDYALLRRVVQTMDDQRLAKREHVREAIKAAGVPVPHDLVRELAQLNPSDAHEVMRDHSGFPAWDALQSYETSLDLFDKAVEDLLAAIRRFEEMSQDGTIFHATRSDDLTEIKRTVYKELFTTNTAAHSLKDHANRLQEYITVPRYKERQNECFGNDGLHDFVMGGAQFTMCE